MKRRQVLLGLALAGAGGLAGFTFRWHSAPRRRPFLTEAHMQGLVTRPLARPRVLFVGNSMTLRHDLVARIATRAAQSGVDARFEMAAANGARLIETWRIDSFRTVLDQGWDVLVLQDFSTACLRAPDRWGSGFAMRAMAKRARAGQVLLYPTWAFPPAHPVYRGQAGFLAATPDSPEMFARQITAHYGRIAAREGWVRAPVTEALQPDASPWLEDDLHHLNPAGADRVAGVLWESLRGMLGEGPGR